MLYSMMDEYSQQILSMDEGCPQLRGSPLFMVGGGLSTAGIHVYIFYYEGVFQIVVYIQTWLDRH